MQVQRLVVLYNSHDWEVEGIAPHTFGGQIQFKSDMGEVKLNMDPDIVIAILGLVSGSVVRCAHEMMAGITQRSIADAGALALEHKNG